MDNKKCNYIDDDEICVLTGEKCENPTDEDCPNFQPWDPDDHLEPEE